MANQEDRIKLQKWAQAVAEGCNPEKVTGMTQKQMEALLTTYTDGSTTDDDDDEINRVVKAIKSSPRRRYPPVT